MTSSLPFPIDIDSLLDRLKSLSVHEEDEDLKMLEDMLKSNDFKKAKHVCMINLMPTRHNDENTRKIILGR